MATKTGKAGNGKATGAKAASSETDAAFTLSQDQMQAAVGLTDVLLKGAEELRRCQMEAAHQAHERHAQAQSLVARARTPSDLYNLQVELLNFDLDASSKYWQRVAAICAETQASTLSLLNQAAATVGGDFARLLPKQPAAASESPQAEASAPADAQGAAAAQVWNQWVELGKQWSDMVYRTEASLH